MKATRRLIQSKLQPKELGKSIIFRNMFLAVVRPKTRNMFPLLLPISSKKATGGSLKLRLLFQNSGEKGKSKKDDGRKKKEKEGG